MNYIHEQAKPSDTDQILFLNNDVVINSTDSIKNMLNLLASNPEIGVVGARLLYTNTDKIQHCGVVIHHYKTPTHLKVGQKTSAFDRENREYQSVTGAVMLVNVKDFNAVKGFNNQYKWAFEDIDLNLKIKYNLGKKVVYCGNTDIFHDESSSLKTNPINKLFMSHNTNVFKQAWANIVSVDIDKYTKKYNIYK